MQNQIAQPLRVDEFVEELKKFDRKEDFLILIKQYEQKYYDAFEQQANQHFPPELQKQGRQTRPPLDHNKGLPRSLSANRDPEPDNPFKKQSAPYSVFSQNQYPQHLYAQQPYVSQTQSFREPPYREPQPQFALQPQNFQPPIQQFPQQMPFQYPPQAPQIPVQQPFSPFQQQQPYQPPFGPAQQQAQGIPQIFPQAFPDKFQYPEQKFPAFPTYQQQQPDVFGASEQKRLQRRI